MLAAPSFLAAEPIEDQLSPTWSNINIESKPRQSTYPCNAPLNWSNPSFKNYLRLEALARSTRSFPVSPQPPIPFQKERPISKPPTSFRGKSRSSYQFLRATAAWFARRLSLGLDRKLVVCAAVPCQHCNPGLCLCPGRFILKLRNAESCDCN